MVVAGHLV